MTIQNQGGRKVRLKQRDQQIVKEAQGIYACLYGRPEGQSRRVRIIAEELRRMHIERAGK